MSNLDLYYQEYQVLLKREKPTNEQIEFMNTILQDITINNKLTDKVRNLLKDKVESVETQIDRLSDLSKYEFQLLIKKLRPFKNVTEKQVKEIKKCIDLKRVKEQFEINSFEDLTHGQLTFIVDNVLNPARFTLTSLDTPIVSHPCYEIGYQYSNLCEDDKMYYLRFYDLMVLDYDFKEDKEVLLENIKKRFVNFSVRIYETHNGFHVFIVSCPIDYNNDMSFGIMTTCACDPYYCSFTRKEGYRIRLSPKLNRNEEYIAKLIYTKGQIFPNFKFLIGLHDWCIVHGDKYFRSLD